MGIFYRPIQHTNVMSMYSKVRVLGACSKNVIFVSILKIANLKTVRIHAMRLTVYLE